MKRKVLIFVLLITIGILVISFVGVRKYLEKKNQKEIDDSIHGVIISEDVPFYARAETENVKQLKQFAERVKEKFDEQKHFYETASISHRDISLTALYTAYKYLDQTLKEFIK